MGKTVGHTLRHETDTNCCRVVPIMEKPKTERGIRGKGGFKDCPLCRIYHPVMALHLWLGPTGEVMVSQDIVDVLKGRADGMDGFAIVGSTDTPPPLKVGDGKNFKREVVDNDNRSQVIYGSELKGAISNG